MKTTKKDRHDGHQRTLAKNEAVSNEAKRVASGMWQAIGSARLPADHIYTAKDGVKLANEIGGALYHCSDPTNADAFVVMVHAILNGFTAARNMQTIRTFAHRPD
jgi:hypothetical protein